jgi:hypothetical protein
MADLDLRPGDAEEVITYMAVLECGHEVPFSIESFVLYGKPTRWWCPKCRKALDVKDVVEPIQK